MGDEVWTNEALFIHFSQRLADQDKAVVAALAAAKEAAAKVETSTARWQAGANEWRGAMTDRERRFVTWPAIYAVTGVIIGVISTVIAIRGG